MFVAVQNVETLLIEFVSIEQVRRLTEMAPLTADEAPPEDGQPQHTMPDGNPWPTTWVHFDTNDGVRVKGSPIMLMNQWFGPPANQQGKQTRQQRRANERSGIVTPSGIPAVDLGKLRNS